MRIRIVHVMVAYLDVGWNLSTKFNAIDQLFAKTASQSLDK